MRPRSRPRQPPSLGEGLCLALGSLPTWLRREGQLPGMQGEFQRCIFLGHEGLQVKREGQDVLADLRGREESEWPGSPSLSLQKNRLSEASVSPDVTHTCLSRAHPQASLLWFSKGIHQYSQGT